jgi:hypothetical protein
MSSTSEKFLIGIFDDEDILLHGVDGVRDKGVKIHEVYSPFPVHGLDEVLGYKRTRLPIAAFIFGLTGTCPCLNHANLDVGLRLAYDYWRKELCFLAAIHSGYIRVNRASFCVGYGRYIPYCKRYEAL